MSQPSFRVAEHVRSNAAVAPPQASPTIVTKKMTMHRTTGGFKLLEASLMSEIGENNCNRWSAELVSVLSFHG